MKRVVHGGFAVLVAAFAMLAAGQSSAHANGVPQLVKLTYLDGVSNFGPRDAEGVLEFSFAEAYARVDVKNLPAQDGYTFEGWLVGGSPPLLVGNIAVNTAGVGSLSTDIHGLKTYDYNLFVVSARKTGEEAANKPSSTSIAGRFAIIGDDGKASAGDVRPGTLPDTGEAPGITTRQRVGRTVIVASAAAGLAFGFTYVMRRRKVSHD